MAWDLTALIAKVRRITGIPSTTKFSDSDITVYINNYYQNQLPNEVIAAALKDWFTFSTVVSTSSYDLDADVRIIKSPATIDNTSIGLYVDQDLFYAKYPQDSGASNDKPADALYFGRTVILQPVPDAVYTFRSACVKYPTALSGSNDTLVDSQWFSLVAYGASLDIMLEQGRNEEAIALQSWVKYYTDMAMGLFPKPDMQRMRDRVRKQ